MNMIEELWEKLIQQPYPYYYCSCYDESTIEKWARKKTMDNLKEMVNNMSETKYVKKDGIVILEETLPEIFNELIYKYYVDRVTVNKPKEYIEVREDDDYSGEKYNFGEYIIIGEDEIKSSKDEGEEYTAYWLYDLEVLRKLKYANNVKSYSINKEAGVMHTHTGYEHLITNITRGVMVFDEDGDFVEVFETDNPMLESAMMEHGYKKVKKNE